jgi:hypothetical protein
MLASRNPPGAGDYGPFFGNPWSNDTRTRMIDDSGEALALFRNCLKSQLDRAAKNSPTAELTGSYFSAVRRR